MKIVLLSTSMGLGGADKQLLSGALGLRARGHVVSIVSLTPLGPMGLEARSLGFPTESLEMRRGIPDPRGLLRLVSLVRQWAPDVVHSHMVHANLMARALRLVVPQPVLVSTIHNIYEGGRLRMGAYRLTNGLVDGMTIISQAAADRFVTEGIVPRHLLRVVPNGVDPALYAPVPADRRGRLRADLGLADEFVWLAVGRFEAAKDYPTMLRAFATVHQRHPSAVLLLVGRGRLQGEAEALTRELGLADRVRFLGVRQDVPDLMRLADAYVMSSAWEGMPMVLLEASAAGLPIVSTAVGGTHEVVRDGETGLLVPPRDPAALASAMLHVAGLPEAERRAMGELARAHLRANYSLDRVVDRWEALYLEMLARRDPALDPTLSR